MAKRLTPDQKNAMWLLARTHMTDQDVADQIGVSLPTLYAWKRNELCQAYHNELLEQEMSEVKRMPYVRKSQRVRGMSDFMSKQVELVQTRATANNYTDEDVNGGMKTGLVVKRYKSIGSGEFSHHMTEYETDNSPAEQFRKLAQHVAQELGEWNSDADVTLGAGGLVINISERQDGPA